MTSLREALRRLLGNTPKPGRRAAQPMDTDAVGRSYRFFWLGLARQWDARSRQEVATAIAPVIDAPGFEKNSLERLYHVPGLAALAGVDERPYSGASLVALRDVLAALEGQQ